MTREAEQDITRTDGRDARWDDHRSARHELILETAIDLIDKQGGDVGVVAIGAAAGVPRSVIYRLFKDREDLDEQIRVRIITQIIESLAPSMTASGSTKQLVNRAARTYVGWVTKHPNLHRFLGEGSGTRPTRDSRAVHGGKAAFIRSLQELIEARVPLAISGAKLPRGTVANLANGLVGMTDAAVNAWLVAEGDRSSVTNLIRFITTAACGQFEAAAAMADATIDLDRRL